MGRRSLAVVLCVLCLAVCSANGAQAQQASPVIAPRDVLTIAVFGEPTLSGKFTVDLDGAFEFPLLGRIVVAGLSTRDFEMQLVKRLSEGFLKSPQASVELEQSARVRVFVMGEVRMPGAYQLAGNVTLIEALTSAGSTTVAAAREVLVLRPRTSTAGPILPTDDGQRSAVPGEKDQDQNAEVIRVDLRELQTGGLLRNNIALRDGDTVFVAKAEVVYITGQVRSPGAYTAEAGMTVLQALSLAGGATDRGATSRIRVIRVVGGDSKTSSIKLTDTVKPGDTLVVPERLF
ncbi:MAG: polysaccharide biosynthesis/export family protein [Vicinamibacterales bacterium]